MTRTVLLLLGLASLSACGEYQGLTANCFDNTSDVVTRSANSMSFLPQSGGRLSTSTAPVDDCNFTPLGGPGGQ
ncbi:MULTISPECIES: hypothetical protein [Halocynthiibacter]|uniref:Lipoprotein n=1 Tax=Halocynthiibacter halioticoli TaxID=2986804 RepID=A0AAE3J4S2_9RHOB|nr:MULTISPECIES: hypothetical protein [Halocynthiibacter]AUR22501.1 hypothetical protein PhaeoP80_04478 [Phaeobacter inhibens]MCV6825962.1 hypothetical protein [Halocynthiibacter halioticoli]MCW4058963.1 hypothetical protein [Halocynthiibacter sp. SDUM655004]